MFHLTDPVIEFHQKTSNSCFLSSLTSYFHSVGDKRAITSLENRIEESLALNTDKFSNIIHFAIDVTTNIIHIKGEQHLRYNLNKWNKSMILIY